MNIVKARNWESFLHNRAVNVKRTWRYAVVSLGIFQALEADPDLVYEETEEDLIDMLREGKKPEWWPESIDRIQVRIELRPMNESPDTREPHPIHPFGTDVGASQFEALLLHNLKGLGSAFAGNLDVTLFRRNTRHSLDSMNFDVEIGRGLTGRSSMHGTGRHEHGDPEMEYWMQETKEAYKGMREMFAQSSANMGAAAALVNASRGHNPTPPWAQEGEVDTGSPWMNLLMHAMTIASGGDAIAGQQQPQQMMPGYGPQPNMQMIPQGQHPMIPAGPQALQIPGPIAADPNDGWETGDQFGEVVDSPQPGGIAPHDMGQYDGLPVHEDEMLGDEDYDEEEEEWGEEYDGYPTTHYEHPEPQPYPVDTTNTNPLDAMTDEQFAEAVRQRAKRMPRGQVMAMGSRIMKEIM